MTARLVLRTWSLADVDAAFGLLGNDKTMGRMRAGRVDTRHDAEVWVSRRIEQQTQQGLTMFAMELRGTPGLVGACGLFPHNEAMELAYIVDHHHVGKGYATEAAQGVCAAARNDNPQVRIYATIRPDNRSSIAVAERVGLRLTSEFEDTAGALLLYKL